MDAYANRQRAHQGNEVSSMFLHRGSSDDGDDASAYKRILTHMSNGGEDDDKTMHITNCRADADTEYYTSLGLKSALSRLKYASGLVETKFSTETTDIAPLPVAQDPKPAPPLELASSSESYPSGIWEKTSFALESKKSITSKPSFETATTTDGTSIASNLRDDDKSLHSRQSLNSRQSSVSRQSLDSRQSSISRQFVPRITPTKTSPQNEQSASPFQSMLNYVFSGCRKPNFNDAVLVEDYSYDDDDEDDDDDDDDETLIDEDETVNEDESTMSDCTSTHGLYRGCAS